MAKCDYKPAQMRHRLTVQSRSRTSDDQGGFTEEWDDGITIWAAVTPLNGWERMQAMRLNAPTTHKIVIRYRSDIDATNRFLLGTRVFEVKEALNENEDNRFLILKALEIAPVASTYVDNPNWEDDNRNWEDHTDNWEGAAP